jgi:ribosome-associated protein
MSEKRMPDASGATGPLEALPPAGALVEAMLRVIDDAKAEDVIAIDLVGKTSLADTMIVASGRSDRHVGAIAERLASSIKEMGLPPPRVEGMPVCDWVLIDTGDVIVHLFRPEVRSFYNLEKLWGVGRPQEGVPDPTLAEKPKKPRAVRSKPIVTPESEAMPKRKAAPRRAPASKA